MVESCWKSIEEKMKIVIPRYVKNICTACGYDTFCTIETIVEADLEYFKEEVVQGKVSKHFDGKFTEEEVLADCNYTVKDFEFSRGHQKLILAVVKFVKETMEKFGVDGIAAPKEPEKATKKPKKTKVAPSKRQKVSSEDDPVVMPNAVTEEQLLLDINKHELHLLSKAETSLNGIVKLLFKKHKEENPDSAIRTEVTLKQIESVFKFFGTIYCPLCKKGIKAFNTMTEDEIPTETWNSSNYDRHIVLVHKAQNLELKAKLLSEKTSEVPSGDAYGNTLESKEKTSSAEEVIASGSADTDRNGEEVLEEVSDVVITIDTASNNSLGGSSSKESHDVSKELKVGDYIQLYVVDLETSRKQTKVAQVISMTENNVNAYFLEKSALESSSNCYFIPLNKDEIFLSKSGIVRILKCVPTSNGGELSFSDILQEPDLKMKPKTKPEMSLDSNSTGKSGQRKRIQKKNLSKERENGWKY